jgi:ATP-dependent Zn protease
MTQTRSTAYHEAGHAVAAWANDLELQVVTIEPGKDSPRHVTREPYPEDETPERSSSRATRQRLLDDIKVRLAGAEAQRRLGEDDTGYIEAGAERDHYQAADLLFRVTEDLGEQDRYWTLLRYQTESIVGRLWWLIEALAAELLRRRTMAGHEVTQFLQAEFDNAHA